ncbi:hypothetical protein L208DRAFT_1400840 [Tricholoma matsutake]|nr:hypothetical protein L208DRAFT_1400840 [Tricholoma matsutake 945]
MAARARRKGRQEGRPIHSHRRIHVGRCVESERNPSEEGAERILNLRGEGEKNRTEEDEMKREGGEDEKVLK